MNTEPNNDNTVFCYYRDQSPQQEWRWRLLTNCLTVPEVIAASQDGHPTKEKCLEEIRKVQAAHQAPAHDYSKLHL